MGRIEVGILPRHQLLAPAFEYAQDPAREVEVRDGMAELLFFLALAFPLFLAAFLRHAFGIGHLDSFEVGALRSAVAGERVGALSEVYSLALIGGGLADRQKGAAYTFVFDGTNWNQEAKIVPSDLRNNDDFGSSVSLSGNRALIGASAASSSGAPGKAYVFVFDGTTWTQEAKLVPDHQTNLDFGVSVSLSGNRALPGNVKIGIVWVGKPG
jgi:hypothetical protein